MLGKVEIEGPYHSRKPWGFRAQRQKCIEKTLEIHIFIYAYMFLSSFFPATTFLLLIFISLRGEGPNFLFFQIVRDSYSFAWLRINEPHTITTSENAWATYSACDTKSSVRRYKSGTWTSPYLARWVEFILKVYWYDWRDGYSDLDHLLDRSISDGERGGGPVGLLIFVKTVDE